jgi:ankyrin repeat protein
MPSKSQRDDVADPEEVVRLLQRGVSLHSIESQCGGGARGSFTAAMPALLTWVRFEKRFEHVPPWLIGLIERGLSCWDELDNEALDIALGIIVCTEAVGISLLGRLVRHRQDIITAHGGWAMERALEHLNWGALVVLKPFANEPLGDGLLPLHQACRQGEIALLDMLLTELGADLEHADNCGSLLCAAVESGFDAAIPVLLEHGASVEARNEDGETCLHVACRKDNHIIAGQLILAGADLDSTDGGSQTALFRATHSADLVKMLLEHGARADIVDGRGQSLLFGCNDDDCIEALVRHGADLDRARWDGQTALHCACNCGLEQAVHSLVRLGANMDKKDDLGRTALGVAVLLDHTGIVNFLRGEGAMECPEAVEEFE